MIEMMAHVVATMRLDDDRHSSLSIGRRRCIEDLPKIDPCAKTALFGFRSFDTSTVKTSAAQEG